MSDKLLEPPVVVNKYYEPYDIYIGRGSKWGNPFTVKEYGRGGTIELYRKHLWDCILDGTITTKDLQNLSGKILGCFCKPKPCHGDVIVEVFNEIIAKGGLDD